MSENSLERLTELHNLVKDHPYRRESNPLYLQSYKKLLCDLAYCFYPVVKETKYKDACNLTHDFVLSILNIGRDWCDKKYDNENMLHVEYCIQTIHTFIDTGTVKEFPDFHMQILRPILGLTCFYKWCESESKFHMKIPEEKVKSVIVALEKQVKIYEGFIIKGLSDGTIKWFKDEIKFLQKGE